MIAGQRPPYSQKKKQRLEFLILYHIPEVRAALDDLVSASRQGTVASPSAGTGVPCLPYVSASTLPREYAVSIWAVRASHGHAVAPGLDLALTQFPMVEELHPEVPHLFHLTRAQNLLSILRNGLRGGHRLGPMFSLLALWGWRCTVGQRKLSGSEYNTLLVFSPKSVAERLAQFGRGPVPEPSRDCHRLRQRCLRPMPAAGYRHARHA